MADRTIDVEIESVGAQGDGVANTPQGLLYVPYTVAGDLARVQLSKTKTDRSHGVLVDLLQPGPDRQPPVCSHFTKCGGCSVQHIAGSSYEIWKRQLVCDALAHRGIEPSMVEPLVSGGLGRRRRTRLRARKTANGLIFGFRASRSHLIVPVTECPVLAPRIVDFFDSVRNLFEGLLKGGEEAEVAITLCANGLDVTIAGPMDPDLEMREALVSFAVSENLARLSWQKLDRGRTGDAETVIRNRASVLEISGISVEPPPDAFVQPTLEGERTLQQGVISVLAGAGRVADLYAGCGAFALALAVAGSHVVAIDSEAGHIDALMAAARRGGLGERVTCEVRDLHRRPWAGADLEPLEGLVLDPPRAGALAQVTAISETPVPVVAYVSCNPASFARDARILVDSGYQLERVLPVDQFLFTPHVELLSVFRR